MSILLLNGSNHVLRKRFKLHSYKFIGKGQYNKVARNHSSLFSHRRRTISSTFFETQILSVFTKELVLHRHARCTLFRFRCNGHSLMLSLYLSRISRIENLLCSAMQTSVTGHFSSHFALSCYGLFLPVALRRFSVSLQLLV